MRTLVDYFERVQLLVRGLYGVEIEGRWESDKVFTMKGQEEFPASHIALAPARLNPVSYSTKDSGDMSAALAPVFINNGLDRLNIRFRDGSSSNTELKPVRSRIRNDSC